MKINQGEIIMAREALFFTYTGRGGEGAWRPAIEDDVTAGEIREKDRRILARMCEERAEIYRLMVKYGPAPGMAKTYSERERLLRAFAERLWHGGE